MEKTCIIVTKTQPTKGNTAMMKKILAAVLLATIALTGVPTFTAFSADETMPEVEYYKERLSDAFVYELRPEKGDEIPFGKGRYIDCYYPRGCGQDRPEFYTWGSGKIGVEGHYVKFSPGKSDEMSVTFDTSPKSYYMDYSKPFFTFAVKADNAFDGFITFRTLDGKYMKTWSVNFTGKWQKVILDFSDKNGWTLKNADGEYTPVYATPFSNEVNSLFGGHAMRLAGTEKCSEYLFDYMAMFSTLEEAQNFTGLADIESTSVPEAVVVRSVLDAKSRKPIVFMSGYPDGTFKPNKGMTRAEACTVLARLMGSETEISERVSSGAASRFTDIKPDAWYYRYIAFLDGNGVLSDFDGEFCPNAPITRAEFVGMLLAAKGFSETVPTGTFTDVKEDTPFSSAIYSASSAGVVSGYADGTFKPDKALSRAEIAVILSRLLDIKPMKDEKQMFSDLDKSFWGYGEIMAVIIPNSLKIDTEKTKTVLAEVDEKAKALKKSITETKTEVVVKGTKYYVAADGNDANDGKSPEKAWKSIAKVSETAFENGDGVFFKRGDTFRVNGRLLLKNGVTYSAYGEGEKPIITASPENGANPDKWELYDEENKVWRYTTKMKDQGTLVFDGGKVCAAKLTPDFKGGKFIDNSGNAFTSANMKNDLELFCDTVDGVTSYPNPRTTLGYIYLRCESGNPGEVFESIEFMPSDHIMKAGTADDRLRSVTIDNLDVRYGGAHGIHCSAASDYTVQNCVFEYIGGGVQSYTLTSTAGRPVRYGNAVELGTCDGFTVKNCYINEIYDAGLTFQTGSGAVDECVKNVTFEGNLIENCTYSVECFMGKPKTEGADKHIENFLVKDNIMRFAGCGFGNTRPDKANVAHIKTWNNYNKVKDRSFVIEGNTFDRSTYMMFHIGVNDEANLDSMPIMRNNLFVQTLTTSENSASLGIFGVGTDRKPYDASIPNFLKEFAVLESDGNVFLFAE